MNRPPVPGWEKTPAPNTEALVHINCRCNRPRKREQQLAKAILQPMWTSQTGRKGQALWRSRMRFLQLLELPPQSESKVHQGAACKATTCNHDHARHPAAGCCFSSWLLHFPSRLLLMLLEMEGAQVLAALPPQGGDLDEGPGSLHQPGPFPSPCRQWGQ